ncbi:MAG: EAL domain-containing protein [Caloramator sp.]|nr:EAL domain-containing protein [Caloramator sp.]
MKNKRIVNLYDMVMMPLFVVILSIILTIFSTYLIGSKIIKDKTKEMGINSAREIALAIEKNRYSLDKIDKAIEDKIITIGRAIVISGKRIDNQFLKDFAYKMGVFEINLFNNKGEIIASNLDEYVGFKVNKDHPAQWFINKKLTEWVERNIRKDVASSRYLRYGYVRLNKDYFIQVGVHANEIYEQKRGFSPQVVINRYINDKNIVFISVYDKNLNKVASIGDLKNNKIDFKPYLKDIFNGEIIINDLIVKGKEINKIVILMPIISNGKAEGFLALGLTLKSLVITLYRYFAISLIIALITSIIILRVISRKVIKPIERLSKDIEKINLEGDLDYRIAISEDDDFSGLKNVINNMLDKINIYLNKFKEHEEELAASNEELAATVQQLTAAEEELRAQYEEIHAYNERLRELQEKYEIAIEGSNSAVWELDLQERRLELSQSFLQALGLSESSKDLDFILDNFLEPEDKRQIVDAYQSYINGYSDKIYLQIKIKDSNGIFRWFLVSARCLNNIKAKKLYGILTEITQLKEKEERIRFLAYNDHLTELPNRRMFEEVLSQVISHKGSGAVALLDIDNFKNINDTKGHVYGDLILKKVAEIFNRLKKDNTMFFRFGGDEFIILIKNEKEIVEIEKIIEDIIKNLTEEINTVIKDVNVTASAGVALYPNDGIKTEDLLMKADAALYRAKYSGKNKYLFFDEKMIEELRERVEIESILRDSLKGNGFKLLYQPIVNVKTKEVASLEALLRLKNYNISPAKFIPIAEETGLIIPIGEWVIKNTIKQLRDWLDKGLTIRPVAINISPVQIKDISFVFKVKKMLEEFNIEPKYIEFEITENIMLEKHDEAVKLLQELKDIGINISLDDFGTGYSSINYLTFLPVDKVKLDKNLSDRFLNYDDKNIIESLISLVKSLNFKVVAEGIENESQLELLGKIGCEYIQGYVISRPLPEEDIEVKFLR